MSEWSFTQVYDVVAATVPDREMVVCGDVRRTYAEVAQRSRGLASFFVGGGIGLHRERSELQRWERGQDAVALVLHNCAEYLESMYGAFRARAVPFNVNQHYRRSEIAALFDDIGVAAVIYHRQYAPLIAEALDPDAVVLIDVDDGSGVEPLPGSIAFEDAVATPIRELPETSPDDLYMICTGGTTGRPKAVLWRQADQYVAGMGGDADDTAESIGARASGGVLKWYAVPPLMHAAAQMTAFAGLHSGATIVLHDDSQPFSPAAIWQLAEREAVFLMTMVGDAYAGPLVEELRRKDYDLSSLIVIGTGGAATNEEYQDAFIELIPQVIIRDGYGASETGGMAYTSRAASGRTEGMQLGPGAAVISTDRSHFLEPGSDEIGWTVRRGIVPLGYLGDQDRTVETFPIIDGERVSIPGDRAQLLPNGEIKMLGRDSMVVNTGGEKVFVEEVEEILRRHPAVRDALVVGRPSARFGQEVTAVVSVRDGQVLEPAELRDFVAEQIARFKAPRAVAVCEQVQRHANGKADYQWAKQAALDAVDIT
ncbi:MAG: AMP-binding protein [Microthrixaceae bacterium]